MRAGRIAWGLWGAALVSMALAIVVEVAFPSPTATNETDLLFILVFGLLIGASATVGALVAARQPTNAVGWTFLAMGLLLAIQFAAVEYADYALVTEPGSLPGGELAAWLTLWLWLPSLPAAGLVLLLAFPDGRALSAGWRRFGRLALGLIALGTLATALAPGAIEGYPGHANPLGIGGALGDALAAVAGPFGAANALLLLPAGVSMALRLRRSRGEQRLQLKWFVCAAVFAPAVLSITFIAEASGALVVESVLSDALFLIAVAGVIALPVAAGIAVLKYRLYEIDVIINRTLVYGALTATLAGAYLVGVLLLGLVVRPLTGSSNLAIAGSTLAVAAVFGPARSRIQAIVDRRFYRRRYDAARTLEAFSARLRNEVELGALSAELRRVVHETIAPAHVSLWLRPVPAVTIPGRSPDTKEPR